MAEKLKQLYLPDVLVGPKGERRSLAVRRLAASGVPVSEKTVANLRCGEQNGLKLEERRLVEGADNAALKNQLYRLITATIVQERQLVQARPVVYSSEELLERAVNNLMLTGQSENIDEQQLRRLLRAMRTDIVWHGVLDLHDISIHDEFRQTVHNFIDSYNRLPPSLQPKTLKKVEAEWEGASIVEYYKLLYTYLPVRTLGIWTPYEVAFFEFYYKNQSERGDRLSKWDEDVLDVYNNSKKTQDLIARIRKLTKIKIDDDVIAQHRNALVYGTTVSPRSD